jgi:hypothetical protein
MFGLRRKGKGQTVNWTALLGLLEDDDRRAAVERTAPTSGRESFLAALRGIEPDVAEEVLAAGRQLHTAAHLVDRPTVAIAGMLNSGKTSLVATFLSPRGRRRTLRGANNAEGTHRFVLWLPSAWKSDVELWGLLLSRIGDALGKPPELLSEDPVEAHDQYNNRAQDPEAVGVALLATDPALDRLGIGLLDCPDIVSDEAFGLGSPETRRTLLGRAATLCSAFLVVTAVESSRDTTLGDLLRIAADLMPGVPRLLAVNKVRPRQTPDQVHEAFRPLVRAHGIDTLFAAYDYDVPASRPYIPNDPMQGRDGDAGPGEGLGGDTDGPEEEPLPVFFSVSPDPDENPPAAVADDRLLSALPNRLDRAQLFERFRLALESGLRTAVWDHGMGRLEGHARESRERSERARECLLEASFDFFAHRDVGGEVTELRLHQSERIVRQLSESFAATAPWYARWGVRMNARMRRLVGGAGDFVRQLTPTALAEKTASDLKDKFRHGEYGGLLTPERLIKAIRRHGGEAALPHWGEQSPWEEAAETAMQRFQRDDFTALDPRRLDEAVRQMWREIPMHRKLATGLTPLLAMFATFGAVLTVPLDLGANLLLSASIPELLAAAGLTTLSAMWAGGKNSRDVGQQAAKQQLANFHAVVCDSFGVARPDSPPVVMVAGKPERLPGSQIAFRESVGPSLGVYRVRDEFRQELQQQLPQSGS